MFLAHCYTLSLEKAVQVPPITTYMEQREFETTVSQNFPINLTSRVPKLSQLTFKLSDVSNLIPNGYGKK